MRKRILLALASGIGVMALSAGTAAAAPLSAGGEVVAGGVSSTKRVAATSLNDAVIKYVGGRHGRDTLTVCRDWSYTGSCDIGSSTGALGVGQDSKSTFGWSDADGFLVPQTGCTVTAKWGPFVQPFTSASKGGRWVELSGLAGGTWSVSMSCSKVLRWNT